MMYFDVSYSDGTKRRYNLFPWFLILTGVLLILKLVFDLSWWVVAAPILFIVGIYALFFVFAIIVMLIMTIFFRRHVKWTFTHPFKKKV